VTREETIICVGCPLGCGVKLTLNDKNEVTEVDGNKCKEGEKFVLEEFRNPVRTLTATVLTQGSSQPLLPVRTAKPILKTLFTKSMTVIARARAKPPISTGDVIVHNLLNTGVDVVASSALPA
jgi:CxxC motif-containing protein